MELEMEIEEPLEVSAYPDPDRLFMHIDLEKLGIEGLITEKGSNLVKQVPIPP